MRRKMKSDYIEFERGLYEGMKLVRKKNVIGLYIIIQINTGLRISDMLMLNYEDVLNKDSIIVKEGKTGKIRVIKINEKIKEALVYFSEQKGKIFQSNKNCVYAPQSINRILKNVFKKESKKLNISSHSLRKSFARHIWEQNERSEGALILISHILNHSSIQVTRIYLGIRQENIDDIYMNL